MFYHINKSNCFAVLLITPFVLNSHPQFLKHLIKNTFWSTSQFSWTSEGLYILIVWKVMERLEDFMNVRSRIEFFAYSKFFCAGCWGEKTWLFSWNGHMYLQFWMQIFLFLAKTSFKQRSRKEDGNELSLSFDLEQFYWFYQKWVGENQLKNKIC